MAKRLLPALLVAAALTAPAAAQERQWSLDASGDDAYLIFGVPDTDDIGLSIWCPMQRGDINIFLPEGPENLEVDKDVTMTLATDDQTAELAARTEANLEGGVTSVEARIGTDHPFLQAMLKADRLKVKVAEVENVFPLFDADLSGLMELCRKL